MPITEAQKRATYAWRARNREEYNRRNLKHEMKYNHTHSKERNLYEMNRYYYRRYFNYEIIAKTFLNILR